MQLFKRGQWLEVQGGARSAEANVAVGRLLEAARRGERFVRIDGDDYAEIETELFEAYAATEPSVAA